MAEFSLVRADATLRATVSGDGPTVLLLHAGAERRSVWEDIAAHLSERGLRTVAYDLRGHGDSSGQPTLLRTFADDVVEMVAFERAPMIVVGASLGGLAAISAMATPHAAARVAGLVLVDVTPDPDPERARPWLSERGLLHRFDGLAEDIFASGPGLLVSAASLDMPVLLVRAGSSPLGAADVDRFLEANKNVEVVTVPTAGHLIARDTPVELAHILASYATKWFGLGE